MENMNEKPDGRDDEVSLVDILSVFIAKRRLWIAITLIGAALGLLVSLSGLLKAGKGTDSSYSSTTRA